MPPRLSKPFRLKTDAEVARAMRPSVAKKSERELEKQRQEEGRERLEAMGWTVLRRGENRGKRTDGHHPGEADDEAFKRGLCMGLEWKRDEKEELRATQIEWYRLTSRNIPYFVCCTLEHAVLAAVMVMDADVRSGAYDLRSGAPVVLK